MTRTYTRFFGFIATVLGLFLMGITLPLESAKMHIILVGDTAAEDLRSSIGADLQTMKKQTLDIARHTQLTPQLRVFSAQNARSQKVLDHLNDLGAEADDVIFFYFSGHGYRTPSKGDNPWPNLYFTTDQTGIDLAEINILLKTKMAHLVVVLADCCNNSLPDYVAPPLVKSHHHKTHKEDSAFKLGLKKLFIDTSGRIMVASSKADQPSWSIYKSGSLYTSAFQGTFNSFVSKMPSGSLEWPLLLDQIAYKTQQMATKNHISQDPIYLVEIN